MSRLFLEATQSLGSVKHLYGDYITSLQQTKDQVNVTFNGGTKESYSLVVAADRTVSTTRPMILDEHTLKDSYHFLDQYIAYFSIPSQPDDTKMWYWYNKPKGLCIMIRPHRNPATMGVYLCITTPGHGKKDPVVEEAMDSGLEATKRMLHQYFEHAGWQAKRALEGMDQAGDFYMSRAAQVKLPKWHNGRAAVLGDAAHATFGVGTTLAVEGAYILAGELSKIQNSSDVPAALVKFEETFRKVYSNELLPGFPQFAFPQTTWALKLRDSLLWVIGTIKLYKLFQGGSGDKKKLPEYDWVDG